MELKVTCRFPEALLPGTFIGRVKKDAQWKGRLTSSYLPLCVEDNWVSHNTQICVCVCLWFSLMLIISQQAFSESHHMDLQIVIQKQVSISMAGVWFQPPALLMAPNSHGCRASLGWLLVRKHCGVAGCKPVRLKQFM